MTGGKNMFLSPALLSRGKLIIEKLMKAGSISEATAKTLKDAAVCKPKAFPRFTLDLAKEKILGLTKDKKYYLK